MRRLRDSIVPAVLVFFLTGTGALLPEAGHTWAHRHGDEPDARPNPHDYHDTAAPASVIEAEHESSHHGHPDLVATAPIKTTFPLAVPARAVASVVGLIGQERRVAPLSVPGPAPPEQAQAPPPPVRASPPA